MKVRQGIYPGSRPRSTNSQNSKHNIVFQRHVFASTVFHLCAMSSLSACTRLSCCYLSTFFPVPILAYLWKYFLDYIWCELTTCYSAGSDTMFATDCIQAPLTAIFYRLGKLISRRRAWFLAMPILVTSMLAPGIALRKWSGTSLIDVFTPEDARAKRDRLRFEQEFNDGTDAKHFSPVRLLQWGQYGIITIMAQVRYERSVCPCAMQKCIISEKDLLQYNILLRVKPTYYLNMPMCLHFIYAPSR